ncbi:transporter, MFS superfamily [Renibacterium salmoninarum ATCC 33209]|uniref:Transporter, MFS superfamily n=1 Tax=Renibacterium salmoninarum (strain ATCC 33209 / DSM 20767 / JCM 11484 / NBRC 15589 / NCIMB 2235) TaxID=288705 RepID=A9WRX1_RENSM|nr:MFS transporter [Renibacterium salmoninarum]ABY24403.1 transporter, MFS superfamily [Renibacterium salmoninarum ATCC 33209]
MSNALSETPKPIRSVVAARMDRLPWTKFHWTVVIGLGVSWILDGLEVQIVAQNGFQQALGMDSAQIGLTGTIYLIWQVAGSLVFGRMADRLGRKRLFILTLAIYLVGSGIAGFSPNMEFLWVFRFIAGMGIGGENTAINSAIDELIPSHYRGRVDIAINGTYWAGAALGATANIFLLPGGSEAADSFANGWGWRIGFFVGPVLGFIIIYLRRHIPESPRWLVTHGHQAEAEATVDKIEADIRASGCELSEVSDDQAMLIAPMKSVPFGKVFRVFVFQYPKRTFLSLSMMITQSFLYNAIFFSYALVLENFYAVPKGTTGFYIFPFAIGNLLGPLLLGPLFDTIGRRKMIFTTYGLAGVVLAVSAALFQANVLNATTHVILWCIAFFFASAGASSAYLTVSEIFPLELRGQAISYFFAVAQIVGALGPVIFGALVGDGTSRGPITGGFYLGSAIMFAGGIIALIFGVNAERQSLEMIADPLSKVSEPSDSKGA